MRRRLEDGFVVLIIVSVVLVMMYCKPVKQCMESPIFGEIKSESQDPIRSTP